MADDEFALYDLRVEVIAGDRPMVCSHKAGDYFTLSGEDLAFPPGQSFPLYPLAAILPLLPAKQRDTHPNDWMTTDAEIASSIAATILSISARAASKDWGLWVLTLVTGLKGCCGGKDRKNSPSAEPGSTNDGRLCGEMRATRPPTRGPRIARRSW